jgi:hypothetical protein
MQMPRIFTLLTTLAAVSLPAVVRAAPTSPANDPAGVEFFEKRVRPVLVQQCYKCHASTSEKVKGSLLLDTRQNTLQGGETGPAVVPGHPEKSLLIEAIKYANDDMQMPPKNRLSANVVADLTKWVQMGAPWPQGKAIVAAPAAAAVNYTANYDHLRKEHWAWQPVKDSPAPTVKDANWARNDIDRYVLARLEEKGLKPVVDADKLTLIRRVTFDLTGLPPTPEEVSSFLADSSPDAYSKRVDKLLTSRTFGERWGRHWLDIARYGESTGSSRNVPYNFAWRYRDYVIDSFNRDKPYNRFVSEQIAGDLMPFHTPQEHNDQLIATGFLAMGVKDLNERDHVKTTMDNVDEQIDVTTRSVMALTVACARCHDHKFDPIPQVDYYSLAGIFKSTEILAGVHGRGKNKGKFYDAPDMLFHLENVPAPATVALPPAAGSAGKIRRLEARADTLKAQFQRLRSGGKANNAERRSVRQELVSVESELDSLRGNPTAGTAAPAAAGSAMGVRDGAVSDTAVCIHGEPHDLGQEVARGFVTLVPVRSVTGIDPSHSGRLQLAQWLTSNDNPLTPRVMVNRIWSHLFGEGIVRTVDNFGSTGEQPANPALLDHLASQFMQDGWSVKQMVREMVMSHAYQLSSGSNPANFAADPDNRLNWRMASRRLDAEELRDGMLAVAGKLDRTAPQGSLAAGLPVAEIRNIHLADRAGDSTYRSVYLPILRDLVPPVLDLFDFAEPTMVIGTRDTTTVATQALFLMNDPFVIQQAKGMAVRVQGAPSLDDGARIDLAYHLALARPASSAEKARALRYIGEFQREATYSTKDSVKNARADAWASFCQALLGSAEFRYLN